MKIAIDIDFTVVRNDTLLYRLANHLQDILNEGILKNRYKPIKIEKSTHTKPSVLNKLSLLNNKNFNQIKNAKKAINELHKSNVIYFVSSRGNLPGVKHLTMQNIEKNGIEFDVIYINCNRKDKFVNEYGVDLFVDDSLYHCETVAKNTKAQSICFNKKLSENSDILFLNDWKDIFEYAKFIYPIINNKAPLSDEFLNKLKQSYKEYKEKQNSFSKLNEEEFTL